MRTSAGLRTSKGLRTASTIGRGLRRRRLEGATCVVTGAGHGIGRETALALSERGCRVLALDIDLEAATQTASACDGLPYQLDVSDRDAVLKVATRISDEQGAIDILVNNAGVGMSARFLDTNLGDWDWVLGVNFFGIVYCCRAFGPGMVERGRGHVVNVSSGLGYFATATEPAYVASKASVLALSRSLRADWALYGVGVSAVCPGVISTDILERSRFRGERANPDVVNRIKEGFARHGHHPRKVANAIVNAIEHNRPVVPVGAEAWAGWMLRGLVPSRLADLAAALPALATRTTPRHESETQPHDQASTDELCRSVPRVPATANIEGVKESVRADLRTSDIFSVALDTSGAGARNQDGASR